MIKFGPLNARADRGTSPHRLVAQDGALSRLKQRFESAWGHTTHSVFLLQVKCLRLL